ncbi:uncharacterized protein J7T54_004072 [Emericellopsis cladophorae]|uniref:F-box domain-containing protein n=1 Tax=Emericellopsis cladophorae TaxID=2686198 RepID=A0A9P9Y0I2_9HYPO|nr:uncharacterized protein J7T54_004072 [Emericellopsis cladophorae]KAI6781299.1 hypothetical protein J7T54_004072 [Emericellopsis cladophorae]
MGRILPATVLAAISPYIWSSILAISTTLALAFIMSGLSKHRRSDAPERPFVPTTVTTSPDHYGRLNPENEANLDMVRGVTGESFIRDGRPHKKHHPSPNARPNSASRIASDAAEPRERACHIFKLPPELIDAVLKFLPPLDLVAAARACSTLHAYALSDLHWQPIVQENVPGVKVATPYPCDSFHKLYAAHELFWFLPRHKIWFSNREMTGRLMLTRYDPRRGCIEGLQLLAISHNTTYQPYAADPHVVVHRFTPMVSLHLDRPILQFKVGDRDSDVAGGFSRRQGANRYADEVPMVMDERQHNVYSNFSLTKSLDRDSWAGKPERLLRIATWPPPSISSRDLTSTSRAGSRPQSRGEVSERTFMIRRWIQMLGGFGGHNAPPALRDGPWSSFAMATGGQIGEELLTYSTLDPELYTPTPERSFRGIWVGDYSGHGCEFLLFNQPDQPPATDQELQLVRGAGESDSDWAQRRAEARSLRGRLEAIKLTGDPNVPRGEYTFVAEELGPGGYLRTAVEEPFAGARVVESKGHVAGTGFVGDKYLDTELFIISQDVVAQYWKEFGHISFFERVNIAEYLNPTA